MDSMICADTSGSMAGGSLRELKNGILTFIKFTEDTNIGSRIGLTEFGHRTGVQVTMTTNYQSVRRCVNDLSTGGGTPMAEGLVHALGELVKNGRILAIGDVLIMPRLILMTDGQPDNKEQVLAVARACAEVKYPIACVGVSGCDVQLMKQIASITGGMFTYANRIEDLTLFFMKQILLTIYITKFAEDLAELYSREVLREFMYEQTGQRLDDDELDLFILYLRALTQANKRGGGGGGGSSRQRNQENRPLLRGSSDEEDAKEALDACCSTLIFICGFCIPLCWCLNLCYCSSQSSRARFLSKCSIPLFCIEMALFIFLMVYFLN